MEAKKNGGPAFPCQDDVTLVNPNNPNDPPQTIRGLWTGGMTLRDYFAAKAMQALLSTEAMLVSIEQISKANNMETDAALAKAAYEYADGMLAERSKA